MMADFKPQDLSQLDKDRFSSYSGNLAFYQGTQWAKTSKNRQLVFNYSKIAIDKITSYLMNGLNYSFEPLNTPVMAPAPVIASDPLMAPDPVIARSGATKQSPPGKNVIASPAGAWQSPGTMNADLARQAEAIVYQVLDQNNVVELDYATEIDAAILGDGCYKVTWDAIEKRVRITAPDVNGLYAWWAGDDLTRVYQVACKYQLTQDEILMLYKKTISKKTAYLTELWTVKDFALFLDNDVIDRKPNPYGFIPFIIFPNLRQPKEFWGISDIPPLQEPQKELNRALSQLSRILEVSGNPIAVLEGVESSEDIQVRPGAVWNLPADTKAYLLDLLQGGGIRLHIDYINLIYQTMHDLSEAPRAAFGGMQHELSGVALEVELQSLLQKVNRKRLVRNNVYKRRNEMILQLWAKFMRQDLTAVAQKVIWGPVLPQDRVKEAQNEQLLVQSGVHSRRTAMDNLGVRDPELEFEKWMEERQRILSQNQEFKAQSTQGGARERNVSADMQAVV